MAAEFLRELLVLTRPLVLSGYIASNSIADTLALDIGEAGNAFFVVLEVCAEGLRILFDEEAPGLFDVIGLDGHVQRKYSRRLKGFVPVRANDRHTRAWSPF